MKVMAFGEVCMRLEVVDHRLLSQSDTFHYLFTGTGLNILAGLQLFGHQTSFFTMLPDNNLGKAAHQAILKYGIDCQHISFNEQHLASYILESGIGVRTSEVTYLNRSESSFCKTILTKDEIYTALEDVKLIHLCGISLTTSDTSQKNLLNILDIAHSKGIKVAFDFNYRPSLNDDYRLRDTYKKVLRKVDIVFGSSRDIIDLLGHQEAFDFESLCNFFTHEYQIDVFAGSIKNDRGYQGFLYQDNRLFLSEEYLVDDFERIGTGDAFAAGILDGIINKLAAPTVLERATAYAVLAHTTYGDIPVANPKHIDAVLKKKKQSIIR